MRIVKIFYGMTTNKLEVQINDWLSDLEQKHNVNSVEMEYQTAYNQDSDGIGSCDYSIVLMCEVDEI